MKRLLKEPMVHFLVLGAALFAATQIFDGNTARSDRIVVSEGKIEHLAMIFKRTWQRPPTRQELDVLVHDFIQEEVAYREGMAMGLDYDDTIIRRRIRQKLDFIAEDLAHSNPPTPQELEAYFSENRADYRIEPVLSFQQVCFSTRNTESTASDKLQVVLATLNTDSSTPAGEVGDQTLLESRYEKLPAREIRVIFGAEFAESILKLKSGQWQGPLRSAYGQHLVRVENVIEGRLPDLDEVRESVKRDLESVRQREGVDRFYQELTGKYDVVVEWPNALTQVQAP